MINSPGHLIALGSTLLGSLSAMAASQPFTIADPESGAAPVVIAPAASALTRTNAEELARIIEQMSGHLPAVTTEAPAERAVVVGTAAEFPDTPRVGELKGRSPEAFLLHSTADRLHVVGNSDLGVQVGVFTLLRELGCRWFFPHEAWTVIPERETVRIELDRTESPDFDYRRIWYGWGARTEKLAADYSAWNRHNRMPGWFGIACSHAWAQFAPGSLLEEHPEYFALRGGARQGHQPCTTHPDVIRLATDHVIKTFEEEPQRNMAPFDPNDNGEFCEGDRCLAVGTVSDRVFLFANTVAEGLAVRFPDKYLGLLAYAWHTDPPSFALHPNVYVQLTRGLRRTKMTWEEQIEAWSDKAGAFGVYDYFSLHEWDGSMPGKAKGGNVEYLRRNIPHYHRLGATTLDGQSGCNWGPNGLGYYLTAQLTWNVEGDVDAIVDDFYAAAFAGAAAPVRRFYERWQDSNEMSERTLVLAYRDLDAARRLAARPGCRGAPGSPDDVPALAASQARVRDGAGSGGDSAAGPGADPVLAQDHGHRPHPLPGDRPRLGLLQEGPRRPWIREGHRVGGRDRGDGGKLENGEDRYPRTCGDRPALRGGAEDLRRPGSAGGAAGGLVPGPRSGHGPAVGAVAALLEGRAESRLFFEKALHYFAAEAGESLALPFIVFPDHTLDGHWTLRNAETGEVEEEGDVREQQNESAEVRLRIPRKGLYVLDPGAGYKRAGRLGFGRRHLVVEASTRSELTTLYPGTPPEVEPLFFFVPQDTEMFVLRVHASTSHESDVRFFGPDGRLVSEHLRLVTGSDLSLPVDVPVTVPAGADHGIWAFTISRSPRATIQLRGVPPYLARHPEELLTSREALVR